MKKILVFSELYWPEGGGGLLATHLIVQMLAKKGFKVTVITGATQPSILEGVKYYRVPCLKQQNTVMLWAKLSAIGETYPIKRLIQENDVVYVPRYCYPIIPIAKRLGKKVVLHLHDYKPIRFAVTVFPDNLAIKDLFGLVNDNVVQFELMQHQSITKAFISSYLMPLNTLCKSWAMSSDEVICVSKRQAKILSKELKVTFKVIYNPFPPMAFVAKSSKELKFLYTGGTSRLKGMQVLINSSKLLLHRKAVCKFMVAKGTAATWEQAIGQKLANSYITLGWVKREELLKLHSSTLALLFPSITEEPLPYVIFEALLQGTIPISSSVGGVPEMVKGTFAEKMLFQPGNVTQFADRMETVLAMTNEQLQNIGYELRAETLRKFNINTIEDKLIKVFANIG